MNHLARLIYLEFFKPPITTNSPVAAITVFDLEKNGQVGLSDDHFSKYTYIP